MKARVMTISQPDVWLWLPTDDQKTESAVKSASEQLQIIYHRIDAAVTEEKIAAILSGTASRKENAVGPDESVLLMDGIDRKLLDSFLSTLRTCCAENEVRSPALKAVVTPTNRSWRFIDLAEELKKERAEFSKQR